MSLGMRGPVYVAGKEIRGAVFYLAVIPSPGDVKLKWTPDRAAAAAMTYQDVSRWARTIPGLFHAKAVVPPKAQEELRLW